MTALTGPNTSNGEKRLVGPNSGDRDDPALEPLKDAFDKAENFPFACVIPSRMRGETTVVSSLLARFIPEALALGVERRFLTLPSSIEASFSNELDYRREFVSIEPDAMFLADIQDDAGHLGKVVAVHQFTAVRAWHIADHCLRFPIHSAFANIPENRRTHLGFSADRPERIRICPHTAAPVTFAQKGLAGIDEIEPNLATRTIARIFGGHRLDGSHTLAAPAAVLSTYEHQPETRRTGHRFETRLAKLALRPVARDCGTAIRAIECF